MPVRRLTEHTSKDTPRSQHSEVEQKSLQEPHSLEEVSILKQRKLRFKEIPWEYISTNPFQARENFDQKALEDLAASIKEHGFITRVRVRPDPLNNDRYQLVFGERRWRAAQLAGYKNIPCEIGNYTDEDLVEIGLIENIQRENLEPLEEAKIFSRLLGQGASSDQRSKPYSIRTLARKLGKNKNYIEERTNLLRLPEDVLQVLQEHPKVSLRALTETARLPTPEEREPIVNNLRMGMMSTEDVRNIVNEVLKASRIRAQREQALNAERDISVETTLSSSFNDETTDPLVFQRALNKTMRRMYSAIEQLEEVVTIYESRPDARKRELVKTHVQELVERIQRVDQAL
jgi:ParB family transcriptional regulator, chromosome partitioning protein